MAPRKTRSTIKAEGSKGSQRTLFDVVPGSKLATAPESIANVESSSNLELAAEASGLYPSSGEAAKLTQKPAHAPKPSRLKGPKNATATSSKPNGAYSIFSQPGRAKAVPDTPLLSLPRLDVDVEVVSTVGSARTTPPSSPIEVDSSPIYLGSSRDEAIIIDSSPVRPIKAPRLIRTQANPDRLPNRISGPPLPPYPTETHLRGSQTVFTASATVQRRKDRDQVSSTLSVVDSVPLPLLASHLMRGTSTGVRSSTTNSTIDDVLRRSHNHPAVRRLVDHTRSPSGADTTEQLIWAEKWHPTAADQVLGNEPSARYLRDWLATLQLGVASFSSVKEPVANEINNKRKRKGKPPEKVFQPTVVRAVERSRRKRVRLDSDDEDTGWIAEDHASDNDMGAITDDDDLLLRPASPLPRQSPFPTLDPPSERASFDSYLTNTILLAGPSGSGKSAAIRACAEELGYEIFEVYPGIGRRSGAELDRLIGDVGKNHLVNKGDSSAATAKPQKLDGTTSNMFSSFLKPRQATPQMKESRQSIRPESPMVSVRHGTPSATSIGQSIVVLEEVDILYQDDVNFWPAVVNIIKDCRRPVILTCNNSSMVPLLDLPLQAILDFVSPAVPLAASFLEALSHAEGQQISFEAAKDIYQSTATGLPSDLEDVPLHPFTQYPRSFDLRLAINMLEFQGGAFSSDVHPHSDPCHNVSTWTSDAPSGDLIRTEPLEQARALGHILRHVDNLSYSDSWLHRIDSSEEKEEAATLSDEVGVPTVYEEISNSCWQQALSRFYTADHTMLQDIFDLSFHAHGSYAGSHVSEGAKEALDTSATFRARADYQHQLVAVLGCLLSISSPLLPRPSVFVDYDAWLRIMVQMDDTLEAEDVQSSGPVRGRTTRNSQKKYVRWIEMSDGHRATLYTTALRWD